MAFGGGNQGTAENGGSGKIEKASCPHKRSDRHGTGRRHRTMGMEKPAVCGGIPVRDTKLFYGHQYIDEADIQAVVDVLKSDYLTCGPKIGELEKKLCQITGTQELQLSQ